MKGWDFYNNKNALKKFNFFILGHHTSSTQLSSIREHGLLTNAMTEHKYVKKKDDIISDENCIYLSLRLDTSYIERAVEQWGGDGLIVLCKVPTNNLLADECMLAPLERKVWTPERQLFESMCRGVCKHKGPISLNNIVGYYRIDGTKYFL